MHITTLNSSSAISFNSPFPRSRVVSDPPILEMGSWALSWFYPLHLISFFFHWIGLCLVKRRGNGVLWSTSFLLFPLLLDTALVLFRDTWHARCVIFRCLFPLGFSHLPSLRQRGLRKKSEISLKRMDSSEPLDIAISQSSPTTP